MSPTRIPGPGKASLFNGQRRGGSSRSPGTGKRSRPILEALETRQLLSTYAVLNTNDSGTGSLRQAIINANKDTSPDDIVFSILASTAPELNVAVPGFDPVTQTWRIQLVSPLPAITNTVSIDGYTEAPVGVPYRYSSITSAVQGISITGSPTGGSFTLTTAAPLPTGTTAAIPWNAGAGVVQTALGAIVGLANVTVTGGPTPDTALTITFQNSYGQQTIQPLVVTSNLTGGTTPVISVSQIDPGGTVLPNNSLTYIQAIPNTSDATQGNNAEQRVIIDGSHIPSADKATGFVLDASHSLLRGLIITGFNVGVSVSATDTSGNPVVGDLIQGNSIGDYFLYPVDSETGAPLSAPDNVAFTQGAGNAQQGVVLNSSNTSVGGSNAQENNVICGNGAQGILVEPGASGNQILGNQIGMAGPSINGQYAQDGNGAEGVLIESSGNASDPLGIVYASSNYIGSASAGNLISANGAAGVRLVGIGAVRNLIQGNYIGVAPGGGYKFGTGDPGNLGDGVRIEDGYENQIGGASPELGNTIDSNHGAGIYITGLAMNNVASYNMIGVTAAGIQVLGNWSDGVSLYSPNNTIGPGNVISQNLRGIGIYGPDASTPGNASDILVINNLIGTDSSGEQGYGNAYEGIRIDNSSDNTIQGNTDGSQVISGNQVGVALIGTGATGNLLQGNFIGSDKTGSHDLGNKDQGILIQGASDTTIGGTTSAAMNLISANHWAVQLDLSSTTDNQLEGNLIGTDITGKAPLGNEVNGVLITGALNNTIGGMVASAQNTIAFNNDAGVLVESGTGDAILSNSIFSNGRLGIDLVAPGDPSTGVTPNAPGVRSGPNDLQNYPVLTSVTSNGSITHIQGTFNSLPDTTFLIQFFTNAEEDPSGYGQGQTGFGSTQVTTDANGNATINLVSALVFPQGVVLSATATNLTTGDTSEFAQDIAQSSAFQYSQATYVTSESSGTAEITVTRSLTVAAASITCATVSGGTAVPGSDYVPITTTLSFAIGESTQSFAVQILDPQIVGGSRTVSLALSDPNPAASNAIDFQSTAVLQINDNDSGSSGQFLVTNTNDSGTGSLRQAILNADTATYPSTILFDIPAATDPLLAIPSGTFDSSTQTWTINLKSPLPAITQTVTIDGYSQAETGVPFRYPSQVTSAVQIVTLTGVLSGGTFTLSTVAPLPQGRTGPIAFDATAAQVQAALYTIQGMAGNVVVSGSSGFYTLTFQGRFAGQAIPNLVGNSSGLTGAYPGIQIGTQTQGGTAIGEPTMITNVRNTQAAVAGNNAEPRVIVNGSQTGEGTGFVINASHCVLDGLIIDGFGIGVSVPNPTNVGNLIQGNFIGDYLLYPVDPSTGASADRPERVRTGRNRELRARHLHQRE